MKRGVLRLSIAAVAAISTIFGLAGGVAPAAQATVQAANLWVCTPVPNNTGACTTITSAPPGGVQVKDRQTNSIWVLYNGDSVQLVAWGNDPSGQCGINNHYYWRIFWWSGGGNFHKAHIGDWYLSTGAPSAWKNFAVPNSGKLGDRYLGSWSGTCDVIGP